MSFTLKFWLCLSETVACKLCQLRMFVQYECILLLKSVL
jgi:hypothetical protein